MGKRKHRVKPYKDYFDITHMIDTAKEKHLAFVFAVSEDKERGCGKTYSSAAYFLKQFHKEGERVMVFVREVKELGKIAEGIFDAVLANEYPTATVYEKKMENIFSTIYITEGTGEDKNTDVLGWVVPLKNARNLKQYRGLFLAGNVRYFYMDEFMPLDGKYLKDETDLMKTIYDTVNGKVEDLPIIMTANCINIGNPYFTLPGVKLTSKIQSTTRSITTDTCIYENVCVEGLADKHMNSAANKAFGKNTTEYVNNSWIGDNDSLVCKPDGFGRGNYICTLVYNTQRYGVYSYPSVGLCYISTTVDNSSPYVYNLTMEGELNIPLLKSCPFLKSLKEWFYRGEVRVANGSIQRMLLDTL